ncbi:MAG: type II toxin-antitoxin system VapC family toxin, partial [Anaerolineales bacterium]
CTTEVVVMELLAGAHDEARAGELRRLLGRFELVPLSGLADFETAAGLYRRCRQHGQTVRALSDCLIAAVAIRADVPVVHADADFEVIARHTHLRTDAPPPPRQRGVTG